MRLYPIFTIIICFILSRPIYSCDYNEESFFWWYFKSDCIVEAEILETVYKGDTESYEAYIRVNKSYKGNEIDSLKITIKSYHPQSMLVFDNGITHPRSDCDVYLYEGERWLFYLKKDDSGNYYTGGQESRSHELTEKGELVDADIEWLNNGEYDINDFFWNGKELDVLPNPQKEALDNYISKTFNQQIMESTQNEWAFMQCTINSKGKLRKVNNCKETKKSRKKRYVNKYDKIEYKNIKMPMITDFEKEARRVTKKIKRWSPGMFCNVKVKCHITVAFYLENGQMNMKILK